MTLNRTLLRIILCDVEQRPTVEEPIAVHLEDFAPAVVAEHVHLAVEAGWIAGDQGGSGGQWSIRRLTFQDHQELARMRRGGRGFTIQRG